MGPMVVYLSSLAGFHATLVGILGQDPVPADDDVVAGGWGALMFVLLILATAFLGWSLTKQLRKVDEAKEKGVYDDPR